MQVSAGQRRLAHMFEGGLLVDQDFGFADQSGECLNFIGDMRGALVRNTHQQCFSMKRQRSSRWESLVPAKLQYGCAGCIRDGVIFNQIVIVDPQRLEWQSM